MYVHVSSARKGFTLIEILIAMLIISIAGVIVAPRFMSYLSSSGQTATKASLKTLKLVLNSYYMNVKEYPDKLRDLLRKPTEEQIAKKWRGPYLESEGVPLDGWENQFVYKKPGQGHPYELYSYGPNGKGADKSEWISVWSL